MIRFPDPVASFTEPEDAARWLRRLAQGGVGRVSIEATDPDIAWDVLEALGVPIEAFTAELGQVRVEIGPSTNGDLAVLSDDPAVQVPKGSKFVWLYALQDAA